MKKERPIYVPPSRREVPAASSSKAPTQRLEVKLNKKEQKVRHAWEVEETKTEKVIHAWEKEDQSLFKLPSKPSKSTNDKLIKRGKMHCNSQRIPRKKRQDSAEPEKHQEIQKTGQEQSQMPSKEENTRVTFVNAQDYLAEMATSDWHDLDEIDYSKVPKWNH